MAAVRSRCQSPSASLALNPRAAPPAQHPQLQQQELYDGLREVYPKPPRISGLAMVEHVTAAQSKQSW